MPKVATLLVIMTLVLVLAWTLRPVPTDLEVSKVRVVIDAGHGGQDPGAIVTGVQEKGINLALALRVAALAKNNPHLEILLTRDTDRFLTLEERLAMAHRSGAALYVSIHSNSFPQTTRCGVETLVDTSRSPGDACYALAAAIQREVVKATGAKDLGVREQALYLRSAKIPAVLVEVGHLSCPSERQKLVDPAYQDKIAQGVLAGILAFIRDRGG